MAGADLDSKLSNKVSSGVRFALAEPRHESEIRRLLRENPMPGDIAITLEREPDYILGSNLPGALEDQTIIALKGDRVVCMGNCSVRRRYINGRSRRVAYLGGLRLDKSARGRFDMVRRGYQFFAELAQSQSAEYYFTSIASDNRRSLRLLERRLPGMPEYRFLTKFVTLLIPLSSNPMNLKGLAEKALVNLKKCGLQHARGSNEEAGNLAEFLNGCGKRRELAANWTKDELLELTDHGLRMSDFHILCKGKTIVAAIALWDQRLFKQTVIRSYSRRLSLLRPWINAAARLLNTPVLPAPHSILPQAFLSPLAAQPGQQVLLPDLIRLCMPAAAARGIKFLTLGTGQCDPVLKIIRTAFRSREYSSRLYQVVWSAIESNTETLGSRPITPDVAFL